MGGGGRYDGLMEEIGGQALTGIGFGLGIDRALLAAEAEGLIDPETFKVDLYLIPLGGAAKSAALVLNQQLRSLGKRIDIAFGDRTLKSAMKVADKSGAKFVLIIGDSELESGNAQIKDMRTGQATSVTLASLVSTLSQESWNW